MHTLLHKIPNPFHTHHHHHHHHESQDDHYAHGHHHDDLEVDHNSEHHHHSHEKSEHAALTNDIDDHDFMDHIGGDFKKRKSSEGEGKKKENKPSFKVNWYAGRLYEYEFNHPQTLFSLYKSVNCFVFFSRYQTPLSPPPETSFFLI